MHRTPDPSRGISIKPESFQWLPLRNKAVNDRMDLFADLWVGTRYMPGACVRGAGVDCAQLVRVFLMWMDQITDCPPIPRLSSDTGVHNRKAALGTIKVCRNAFPSCVVRDGTIQPGDIVLTRSTRDWSGPLNPGHAMIVLPLKGTALHAMPATGVTRTSIASGGGIVRVYRPEKDSWRR